MKCICCYKQNIEENEQLLPIRDGDVDDISSRQDPDSNLDLNAPCESAT